MLRHFTDANGRSWRVWDVWPSTRPPAPEPTTSTTTATTTRADGYVGAFAGAGFADGWLCFEGGGEKRRLSPIPPEWESCEECLLDEMCRRAGYITLTPRDSSALGDHAADAD